MKNREIVKMLNDAGFQMSESYFYRLRRAGLFNKNASFEDIKTAFIELQNTQTVIKPKLEVIMENRKAKE